MKKMIYIISIISLCIYNILTIEVLPFIFSSSWQGLIYILVTVFLSIIELILVICNSTFIKECYIFNLAIVFITMYLGTIYYKIYTVLDYNSGIRMNYCKSNFFFVSLFIIATIIYLYLSYNQKKKS